ncbi:hypothetical protein TcBrA4_0006630 [Trypanosoma cruzi]|nr:hypothetical protein TcBrA4_0006630 [Trypanosoma cruzi]
MSVQRLLEVLKLDEFTSRVRDITKRAFDKARALGSKLENKGSEDFVEFLGVPSDAVLHLRLLRADGDVRRD